MDLGGVVEVEYYYKLEKKEKKGEKSQKNLPTNWKHIASSLGSSQCSFPRVLECHGPASLPVRPLELTGVGVPCYCRRPLRNYGTSSHQSRCAIFLLQYLLWCKNAATVAGYHELIGEIPSSRLKEAPDVQ